MLKSPVISDGLPSVSIANAYEVEFEPCYREVIFISDVDGCFNEVDYISFHEVLV